MAIGVTSVDAAVKESGWFLPRATSARKFHFFLNGMSLCGHWKLRMAENLDWKQIEDMARINNSKLYYEKCKECSVAEARFLADLAGKIPLKLSKVDKVIIRLL